MRVPRPSPEEQKKEIEDVVLVRPTVSAGDTWYIVSNKWFQVWEEYVQNPTDNNDAPGPIDNSLLVNGDDSLKRDVTEHRDYEILPEEAWNLLYQWYSGGPVLPRKAIKVNSNLIVEVRLLTLNFAHKEFGTFTKSYSKADKIGDVKKDVCTSWNLDMTETSVWDALGEEEVEVENMDKLLYELHITDGTQFRVSDKKITIGDDNPPQLQAPDSNGTEDISVSVPSSSSSSSYISSYQSSSSSTSSYSSPYSSSYSSPYYSSSSYSSSYTPYSYQDYSKPKFSDPGLVGLNNLGNTCFMNSSLQCLSNTVPLTQFFLAGAYERDINFDNPLGTKGKLAEAFAKLIKDLWNGHTSSVAPRDFKMKLEGFAQQFSGYQQHDSQELLAFLLDGLHEDLNRVKQKKYAAPREGDDISDDMRAKEAWEIHKNRNDSVIVDWFQAALKSTLVCPTCARVSVTFDPFMYLSLPLPMKTDRSVPITLLALDAKPPTKYLVKVPKIGSIATLKGKLGELANVNPDCMILTDVFNSKFFKKFNDAESVDAFDEERDVLYAYEVVPQNPVPNLIRCAVYNRKEEPRNPNYPSYQPSAQIFGTPFFVSVPQGATYREIYSIIKEGLRRWLKEDPERQEQQPDEAEKGEVKDEEEPLSDDEDGTTLRSSDGQEKYMFAIQSVDNHGFHETPLHDNGGPVDLENRSTLAIHWKLEYIHLLGDTKNWVNHSSMSVVDPSDPDGVTLDKCMSIYTTTELLGPDDPWYCNRCKEHKQATKKFDLWSLPRILVVHLKRFSYRNKYFREKLETLVSCPLQGLDMANHLKGPVTTSTVYDLYAVSNHYGSLGGGHYTAYALNKHTNKWYKFDDSHVSEIDESQVVSSSAYVLFYRRRDTTELSAVPADFVKPVAKEDDEDDTGAQDNGSPATHKRVTTTGSSMELD